MLCRTAIRTLSIDQRADHRQHPAVVRSTAGPVTGAAQQWQVDASAIEVFGKCLSSANESDAQRPASAGAHLVTFLHAEDLDGGPGERGEGRVDLGGVGAHDPASEQETFRPTLGNRTSGIPGLRGMKASRA